MQWGLVGKRVGIGIMGPSPLTKSASQTILFMVAEVEPMKTQDAEMVALIFFNL